MYTGQYDGIPLTTINGGRFAADTAITTEILCNAQVKAMIRVGSCGALREDIKVGDLVIATTALKGEGVTKYYVGKDFVPTADAQLTRELTELTQKALKSPLALGRKVMWMLLDDRCYLEGNTGECRQGGRPGRDCRGYGHGGILDDLPEL